MLLLFPLVKECPRIVCLLFVCLFIILLGGPQANAQQSANNIFEHQTDVGNPETQGNTLYDKDHQSYVITGVGSDMWYEHDEFHFSWRRLTGDFIIRARAHFLDDNVEPLRKLGLIVRSSLDDDAAYVDAAVHGNGLTSLQFRKSKGDSTQEKQSDITKADVIQLERRGDTFIMSVARFGDTFTKTEISNINLGDQVYVGIFACPHGADKTTKAEFSNVRIIKPAPDTLVPYQDYLASNLEVMNVDNGQRKILHYYSKSLQAPNWTPDGKTLIYNKEGLLYKFNLSSKTPSVLETGFANQNNNDHVLSFDGKRIGMSNLSADHEGNSIIYTVPINGGTPSQVTPTGPSYLHGWSPDGQWLTYTGRRNGDFDIYKIPVDGGKEIRLTTAKGLDDGPEYSPDGKYIYFNSVRSGTMELWRMHPDGSDPEQLTDDKYNNWFPHISPDGKRIIFISFPPSVAPGDHPFYKRVYLRMMPVDGGKPTVVAYVYGGQGTMNVPSWSPDGTKVAFISNTGIIK